MLNKEAVMGRCIELARNAKGFTLTNPLVGAAVIKNGQAVYGIHEKYGTNHAEVNAIKNAGEDVSGCELFVTLEPCSTYGKTPPCVEKIISSGIKKVYIGVLDINPKHRGQGVNILKNAGIEVEYGILAEECSLLIEDFIKYQTVKLPYVTLKTASSIDGRIACKTGHSKWITGEYARELVHKMRGSSDVVLTGIGTVEADNPLMTDRRKDAVRQPVRAVLDSSLKIDINANIINSAENAPVVIYTSENADSSKIMQLNDKNIKVIKVPCINGMLDIKEVLHSIYELGYMNVFVEAGSRVNGSFFDNRLVDRLEAFIAPKVIGGKDAISSIGGFGIDNMNDAVVFKDYTVNTCGNDILISARINDYAAQAVEFTKNYNVE